MRRYLAVFVVLIWALPAAAQPPYYARGTFGDPANDMITGMTDPWNDLTHQMVDQGGGHYTATVGDALTYFPGVPFDYKLANADYSTVAPSSSDGRIVTDNNGEMNFNLWTNNGDPWTDGWYPNNGPRAGYQDPQQFGWEVVGSFNGWSASADPNFFQTTTGDGVYTGTFAMTAGSYQFKFREQGNWDVSIGADFGNHAANNAFRVWDDGEQWTFSLDLPNGRWQAASNAPTPDLNGDGYVDSSDYVLWRKSNGSAGQYEAFRKHFGEAPPPPPPTQFYARGEFNNYDQSIPMTDQGAGLWEATVTGLTAGQAYKFKLANEDYSQEAPQGSFRDGKVEADANGEIHFHLYDQTTWTDGWNPSNERRAGYDDPGLYGWELMGDFNGFTGGPTWIMNNQGNGLYTLDDVDLAAGTYEFKFRKNEAGVGDWGINIGENFGNDGPNASTGDLAAGLYNFQLDLRNGRWRVAPASGAASSLVGGAVPEPASIVIAMMTIALVGLVRRRERG